MEEYKVGEVFQFGKIKLKCVEAPSDCTGCFLLSFAYCISCIGECNWNKRSDHKNVIFIELKEENNGSIAK